MRPRASRPEAESRDGMAVVDAGFRVFSYPSSDVPDSLSMQILSCRLDHTRSGKVGMAEASAATTILRLALVVRV